MKAIEGLKLCIALVGTALILANCAHKPYDYSAEIAQCTKNPPPTAEQIRAMPTSTLYAYYKASLRASDDLGTATVLKQPIDPCGAALAMKSLELERELKYR